MKMYKLEFTENAKEIIEEKNIKELYISIRYVQGPCSDNLCKLIPKIEVSTEKHENAQYYPIFDGFIKVYTIQPIIKTIEKYRDKITVNYSRFRNKFTVTGITYSY